MEEIPRFDDAQSEKIDGKELLASLLSKASSRGKRKQPEEPEDVGRKEVKEGGKTKAKKSEKAGKKKGVRRTPEGPKRDETREERDARKAAAKLAKKERKAKEKEEQDEGGEDEQRNGARGAAEDGIEWANRDSVDKKKKKSKKGGDDGQTAGVSTSSEDGTEQEKEKEKVMDVEIQEKNDDADMTKGKDKSMSTLLALKKSQVLNQAGQPTSAGARVRNHARPTDEDDVLDAVLPTDIAQGGSGTGGLAMTPTAPMRVSEATEKWGLDVRLAKNLEQDNIINFFPVQCAVIPALIRSSSEACIFPRDLCVSAPTGSGKTIAYALPIVQFLSMRTQPRLSAVIILPSRELASQVYRVFCRLARISTKEETEADMDTDSETDARARGAQRRPLRVMLSTGHCSLEEERRLLQQRREGCSMQGQPPVSGDPYLSPRNAVPTGRLDGCGRPIFAPRESSRVLQVGEEFECSGVDVMVCTPARLLEHIDGTVGFTLRHLRYLVLDEADRLLGNAYHSWVTALVRSCVSDAGNPRNIKHGAGSLVGMRPLQRLLFSATLTENPRKLALLGINNPILIRAPSATITGEVSDGSEAGATASTMYTLPKALSESVCLVEAASRPIQLIAMLTEAFRMRPEHASEESLALHPHLGMCHDETARKRGSGRAGMVLVFVSSVESTHRLCRLLQIFNRRAALGLVQRHDDGDDVMNDDDDDGADGEQGGIRSILESIEDDEDEDEDESNGVGGDNFEFDEGEGRDEGLDSPTDGSGSSSDSDRGGDSGDDSDDNVSESGDSNLFFGGRVVEMSRLVRAAIRDRTMRLAMSGGVKVMVSSDHLARGIDLSNIDLVINYDPPKHARTYVHRVGRTARAGRGGHAVTMVRKGQQGTFARTRGMVDAAAVVDRYKDNEKDKDKDKDKDGVVRLARSKVKASTVDEVREEYSAALRELAGVLRMEQAGELRPDEKIPGKAATV